MDDAASRIVGDHDFRNLCKIGGPLLYSLPAVCPFFSSRFFLAQTSLDALGNLDASVNYRPSRKCKGNNRMLRCSKIAPVLFPGIFQQWCAHG